MFFKADTDWFAIVPLPWRKFVLIDGTTSRRGEHLMRRRRDGKREYRRMTEEEAVEEFRSSAM